MKRFAEPTSAQLRKHRTWLARIPPSVRARVEHLDPWSFYQLKSTSQVVRLAEISVSDDLADDVTLVVLILMRDNPRQREDREVFDVPLDDLTEMKP